MADRYTTNRAVDYAKREYTTMRKAKPIKRKRRHVMKLAKPIKPVHRI